MRPIVNQAESEGSNCVVKQRNAMQDEESVMMGSGKVDMQGVNVAACFCHDQDRRTVGRQCGEAAAHKPVFDLDRRP